MLRKLILGLVATASLGAMALAPSAASAHSWGGGWGGFHHFHGYRIGYIAGPATFDGGCYVTRRVMTRYGYRLRTFDVCH